MTAKKDEKDKQHKPSNWAEDMVAELHRLIAMRMTTYAMAPLLSKLSPPGLKVTPSAVSGWCFKHHVRLESDNARIKRGEIRPKMAKKKVNNMPTKFRTEIKTKKSLVPQLPVDINTIVGDWMATANFKNRTSFATSSDFVCKNIISDDGKGNFEICGNPVSWASEFRFCDGCKTHLTRPGEKRVRQVPVFQRRVA